MYQNTSYMGLEIIFCNLNNISLLSILRVRETVFYYRFSIVKLFLCIHDGTLVAARRSRRFPVYSFRKQNKIKCTPKKQRNSLVVSLSIIFIV